MSMITYPLNNIEYTAEDAELFHSTRTSGVYATDSFDYSVTGADATVVIGKGIAWIKNSEFSGKVVAQKESIHLDMGLPDPNYTRIDAIAIQFDAKKNASEIIVKTGIASSTPVAPSVIRTDSVYELHLYHIRRSAGELTVSSSSITDLRPNSNYCGLMSDSVTQAVDSTLSKSGIAADAASVGIALSGKMPLGNNPALRSQDLTIDAGQSVRFRLAGAVLIYGRFNATAAASNGLYVAAGYSEYRAPVITQVAAGSYMSLSTGGDNTNGWYIDITNTYTGSASIGLFIIGNGVPTFI